MYVLLPSFTGLHSPQPAYRPDLLNPFAWPIGEMGNVLMLVENSAHYQLDTEEGIQEWAQLVPTNGIIRLPGDSRKYTISMFHQLRCLDVLRTAVVEANTNGTKPDRLTRHCLNYIRQMILCRSDLFLENVRDPHGPHAVDLTSVRTCKDRRMVYESVGRAQKLIPQ